MDLDLIADCADVEVPGLRDTARRFLEAQVDRLGVPLDPASVMARRAEGVPELYVTAAADELVTALRDRSGPLADDSRLMVLAWAGARALISRVEIGEGQHGSTCLA